MLYQTDDLSLDRAIIFGGVRRPWRQGACALHHGTDQIIRFMQHVRRKLALFVVMIRPGFAALFRCSKIPHDPLQLKSIFPRVAQ